MYYPYVRTTDIIKDGFHNNIILLIIF